MLDAREGCFKLKRSTLNFVLRAALPAALATALCLSPAASISAAQIPGTGDDMDGGRFGHNS